MKKGIAGILLQKEFTHEDITVLLRSDEEDAKLLYAQAAIIKEKYVGNTVYLRGLIEYSNVCGKNCLYCGSRRENRNIKRYTLSEDEALEAVISAWRLGFGSVTIQGGEIESDNHADKIESLIRVIREKTNNEVGVTLSLGEQERDVYRRWYNAGAHRYLLRLEATGRELYNKIHPLDKENHYEKRHACLRAIKETGFQTGTGLLIGLPHQTLSDLADDLIFLRDFDIDMCVMSPFIEHTDTSEGTGGISGFFLKERLFLTLKMTAILRIIMKDINIISSSAMQAVDTEGREKAILAGANIIMPNITPLKYREGYKLYNHKQESKEIDPANVSGLNLTLLPGTEIGLKKWGDATHYKRRKNLVL